MDPKLKGRRRGVPLSPDAIQLLIDSATTKWQREKRGKKLTRASIAELLGLSLATTERIVSGTPVDRASLQIAFNSLDIPWREEYLVGAASEDSSPKMPEIPNPPKSEGRPLRRVGLLVLSLVPLVGLLAFRQLPPSPRAIQVIREDPNIPAFRFRNAVDAAISDYYSARYLSARSHINEAIQCVANLGPPYNLSVAMHLSGDIESALGNKAKAEETYQRALSLREYLPDKGHLEPLYEALGVVQSELGKAKEAKRNLYKSLAIYEKIGDKTGVAMVQRDLAKLELSQGNIPACNRWINEAMKVLVGMGKPQLDHDIRAVEAMMWLKQGKLSKARLALQECLQFWKTIGNARWLALTHLQLAQVCQREGQREEFAQHIQESYRRYVALSDAFGKANAEKVARDSGLVLN